MANSGSASRVKLSQGMVIDSGRSKVIHIIITKRKEYGDKRNGYDTSESEEEEKRCESLFASYNCSNPAFTSISLYMAHTTLLLHEIKYFYSY
mmetsp:Transcript_28508/g.57373  ORF Transcript_28508/g.57373 Transcript_28508/m.57373 type:complete len:93 (-) Transcript_28508:571-849(-)